MSDQPILQAANLSVAYGERPVIRSLDLTVMPGKVTAIVGANGCGKSTLLHALARLLAPQHGVVTLDGRAITRLPTKRLATKLGLLPQAPTAPEGITVTDLVGRGRYPHQGMFATWSKHDYEVVAGALEVAGITGLADRSMDELSGGQRQRAWIAMALAQETGVLLLDEPTTYLDISHQIEVLDLLTDLNRERGTTIVMVLHDVNLAARYADELIAMRDGEIYHSGSPHEVITEESVREVFGLTAQVVTDPTSATPLIVPIGRHHARNADPSHSH